MAHGEPGVGARTRGVRRRDSPEISWTSASTLNVLERRCPYRPQGCSRRDLADGSATLMAPATPCESPTGLLAIAKIGLKQHAVIFSPPACPTLCGGPL